jgi:zinc protease
MPTLISFTAADSSVVPSLPSGVRSVTLANGLMIITREDHSAPVVSAQLWCRAGSVNEGRWLGAGLSHVLEHMLFKGTTTRGAGRIDQEVQAAGGYMNAYTSFDRTVYWINVPNTGARVALDVLADIAQHASLPAEELAKEMDVIRREMDMCHDDPGRRSSRRLFETAYTRSPYRFPIIGLTDIFGRLQRDDIVGYYTEQYAPNNLVFVVVGDIQPGDVVAQLEAAFKGSLARPVPGVVLPEEPRQLAERVYVEEAPIELAHLHLSWHVPDLRHPDLPALDVLSLLLGGGRSSRLFQEVREKLGVVSSVDAWTYSPGAPGMLGVSAVMDAANYEPGRNAILTQVERMRNEAVTPAELGKAVKQFTVATLGLRKTMQGQAQDLGGAWFGAGDLNFSARYLAAVERVTPDDILRVARTYLTAGNRTVCALLPSGTAPTIAVSADVAGDHPVQRKEFPNGLRLLVKEDHRLPFVELRVVLAGGVLAEDEANSGITGLMTKLLLKGTPTRTAAGIAGEIESVGGSLDAYAGNNSFGVTVEVLASDLTLGLDLLRDTLLNSTFPEAELEREREYQLDAIRSQKDQLLQCAGKLMRRTLFGPRTYGLDANGSEESVARISQADIRAMHRRLVIPNNTVLAVYGDVSAPAIETTVAKHFGDWTRGECPVSPVQEAFTGTKLREVMETRDKRQAVIVLGFPGAELANPDRIALDLLQEACSDLGSRLFMRIRDELGLAYYVGTQNFVGIVPGHFAFYAGTEPEKVDLVKTEFLEEITKLQQSGLTEDELLRAKAKVLGQRKIARQELSHQAMTAALDELYGMGFDYAERSDPLYEAVTLDQIRLVAQKYLRPEMAVAAVIRPEPT